MASPPGWKHLGPLFVSITTHPSNPKPRTHSLKELRGEVLTHLDILPVLFSHLTYKELIAIEQMSPFYKEVLKDSRWDWMLFRYNSKTSPIPRGRNFWSPRDFTLHPILEQLEVTRDHDWVKSLRLQSKSDNFDAFPDWILDRCAIWPPRQTVHVQYPWVDPVVSEPWARPHLCLPKRGGAFTIRDFMEAVLVHVDVNSQPYELCFNETARLEVALDESDCLALDRNLWLTITLKRSGDYRARYRVRGGERQSFPDDMEIEGLAQLSEDEETKNIENEWVFIPPAFCDE